MRPPFTSDAMMITYDSLALRSSSFRSLCGLSVAEFEQLFPSWHQADGERRLASRVTRQHRRPRRRAVGAGTPYGREPRTRLLMALVWLKLYPTWEVLGYLFDVHETTAMRDAKDVLQTLEAMGTFPLERPRRKHGRSHGRSLAEVIESVPEVRVLVDSKEQRIRRPSGGWEAQNPYYSGKKKAHTLKTQLATDLEGRILAVSESVPGPMSDIDLLRQSGLPEQLTEEEALAADGAYVGSEKDYPAVDFYLPVKKKRGQPLTEAQKAFNQGLAFVRVRIEHTFAWMNRFGACAEIFRQRRRLHARVVRVVALLVDRQLAARGGAVCLAAA